MKTKISYIITIICFLIVYGCSNDLSFDHPEYSTKASTTLAQNIISGTNGYFGHIKYDKVYNVAQDVTLLDMSYINLNGYAMRLMMYKIVLGGNVSLAVTMPENQNTLGMTQKLSEQSKAMDNIQGINVLGAVNGDFFNAGTGMPSGIVHRNGKALKSTFDDKTSNFFAITKEGNAGCYTQSEYNLIKNSIVEAIGCKTVLLNQGYVPNYEKDNAASRVAVGVSFDKGTVYLMVVDGVDHYYSNGITMNDMGKVLKAAGAYNALSLDAGKNATLVNRNEFSENIFEVFNEPSNNKLESAVANGIAIIEK